MSAQPLPEALQRPTLSLARHAEPADAIDVAAMPPQQRAAWLASTNGRKRHAVLIQAEQRDPGRRPRWRDDAACLGVDADLVELDTQLAGASHVNALCAPCPVLAWCAASAREHEAHGLWAGVVLNTGRPSPEIPPRPLVDPERWLVDQLARGPRLRTELLAAGRPLGIAARRLTAAADALGITRTPGRPWALPEQPRATRQTPIDRPRPAGRPRDQRRQPRRLTRARRRSTKRMT